MNIDVVRGGLMTTVQDQGRDGWRRYGVPGSGALDFEEARAANALVGNGIDSAFLESTLDGPILRFPEGGLIALCGADVAARVDGCDVPMRHPILLPASATLETGHVTRGCRFYIAIAGGLDVPIVLGSRSTCLRAAFGGHQGRVLRAGDRLPVGPLSRESRRRFELLGGTGRDTPVVGAWRAVEAERKGRIAIVPGEEYDMLDEESRRRFLQKEFIVDPASDRMGLRLHGGPLHLVSVISVASRAVIPGAIQLPPDGEPMILLADCGTTGGYPVIGYVARKDMSRLGQAWVGDTIGFELR